VLQAGLGAYFVEVEGEDLMHCDGLDRALEALPGLLHESCSALGFTPLSANSFIDPVPVQSSFGSCGSRSLLSRSCLRSAKLGFVDVEEPPVLAVAVSAVYNRFGAALKAG
jgi:hypothetical protein